MTNFIVEMWESVFTPGPTPVLLKATNVTFGALQILLLILFYSTLSIHFVVLSIISGGLWWAINWFARELAIHQAAEETKARKQRAAEEAASTKEVVDTPPSDADDDEDTEVDEPAERPKVEVRPIKEDTPVPIAVDEKPITDNIEAVRPVGELKKRVDRSGVQSGANTEDEWERVSEYEKDK